MASYSSEALNRTFLELRSKNEDTRLRASTDLKTQVEQAVRDLPSDRFQEYYNNVNHRVSQLVVQSNITEERVGGIQAIEELIKFDGDDAAQKTTRFSSYLRAALRSNDTTVLLFAARALGKLAIPGGALTAELVEAEISSALEWLQIERQETRRFAAVLIIRELAINSPTLLYAFVPQIFDCVLVALRDPKILIRETAAEAAGACIQIIAARDEHLRKKWFARLYDDALQGFKSPSPDTVHGSLLTVKELLVKGGMFMHDHYREACEITLRLKDHKEPRIRAQVVAVIPILAGRDRGRADEAPVFQCISMLALAVGMALTKYTTALLDPMLACGLSSSLKQALHDMAHCIHPIKPLIQEKLLDLLSLVLSGKPFKPLGCPPEKLPPIPAFAQDFRVSVAERSDSEIILALNTLGSFDFAGQTLNEFIRDVAMRFTESTNPNIRKAAAITCCQLFVADPIINQTSFQAIKVVDDVVTTLLELGVADQEADIRHEVLNALDCRLNKHLGKPENIRSVFLAAHDGDFQVRQAAIVIIGRLTEVNPAHIFPSLRKILVNLIMGIKSSKDAKVQEDDAKLVGLVISHASKLAKPYCDTLVKVLLPQARDSNNAVAATTITAIGQLATTGGTVLEPYIPLLMPTIVEALQDLSFYPKRQAALHTLGQLASNSGYVIKPYEDYPQLLDLLTNIIKSEQSGELRKETIKLMGILGALDPYKHQTILDTSPEARLKNDAESISDVGLVIEGLTPSNEDYYPKIVFNTLTQTLLADPSLSQYHSAVIEAIVTIFKTLGLRCIPFLNQIIPSFVTVIRSAPYARLEAYFNQLSILVSIVRMHIRNYAQPLIELIEEFWSVNSPIQATVLSLVESLAKALEGEFKGRITRILPLLLKVLEDDTSARRLPSERCLHTILVFGQSAEEHMHLIIPTLVHMFQKGSNPVAIRKAAIDTIGKISRVVNISDYASLIIHNLTDTFAGKEQVLKQAALDCICAYIFQLGRDYLLFVKTVKKILDVNHVPHHNYDILVSKLQKGEPLPQDLSPDEHYGSLDDNSAFAEIGQKKLPVNQEHLKNAFEASQKSTIEDWQEWIRRFSVELLRESPQHALRACAGLGGLYQPLAKDLFNSAFASCWGELYDQYQEELLRSLEIAVTSPNVPPDILQVLLNLCEFMEHDDKALAIDIRTLGAYAAKNHAFAKALHYKELEFEGEKTPSMVEALISINNQLQQSDAAVGILRNAQKYRDFELKETWFEKLERWDEALAAYQRREREFKGDQTPFDITMGKMRCLHALGEWDTLSNLAEQKWSLATLDHKRSIAPLAAAAAWGLGQWELMDNYLDAMKMHATDRSWFSAILALHRNHFEQASLHIANARDKLDSELCALLGESYTRAYGTVVRVQMLAELDEIIIYKKSAENPEKQATMRDTWTKRLKGCQPNIDVWQRMLKVRALVLTPKENLDMWIKFANLCRKSGRIGLAEKSLALLHNVAGHSSAGQSLMANGNPGQAALQVSPIVPEILYAQLKYQWATGQHQASLHHLRGFSQDLSQQLDAISSPGGAVNGNAGLSGHNLLLDINSSNGVGSKLLRQDMHNVSKLLAKCYVKQGEWMTTMMHGDWESHQVRDIIDAYAHATSYNKSWYKAWHSWALANFEVVTALTAQAKRQGSSVSHSMLVDHVVPAVRGFLKSIALSSASSLQDTLRLLTLWFAHGGDHEVNTAILECFSDVSVDTWLEVIPQLIARINQPNNRVRASIHRLLAEVGKVHPQALVYPLTVTMKSNAGRRAQAAGQIMEKMREHSPLLVEQADLVSHELIRVAVLWHELWHEGLEEASRLLKDAKDLSLAVPGTYQSGKPVISIISFDRNMIVIPSKQRPRRMTMRGSDGVGYEFCLKGHEDIRQDERVMQLFGLVNTLLNHDGESFKRHLNIQRYPAIPLSQQSGLLGWVPNSDTMHNLIKEYREHRRILLNIEHRIMLQMAPDYDNLTLMQKVEVFSYAMDNTTGKDLYRVLWLKSKSSESWLERRTNYTRSLATMSMVGYILGLGDRHPSNLMLDKITGKIVHIDFGDCFEVAMHREKYPERVPFRLTRMLTYAMEVSNIDGSYKVSAESVMRVIRDNKESLMAVLEAFVHDPLLNWRLGHRETPAEPSFPSERRQSIVGDLEAAQHERPRTNSYRVRRLSALQAGVLDAQEGTERQEVQNARALQVLGRVKDKLMGRDFKNDEELSVERQVAKLVAAATNVENLCQHYIGWCSFW
ncbi:serine/threonine-protein kinase mTOR, partial [Lecanoromycetidae sp. Uapishka_2]